MEDYDNTAAGPRARESGGQMGRKGRKAGNKFRGEGIKKGRERAKRTGRGLEGRKGIRVEGRKKGQEGNSGGEEVGGSKREQKRGKMKTGEH